MGPEDELVDRYQQFVSPYQGRIRVGVSLFFALIAGVGVSSQWQEWMLFTHRVDFGVKDPQFDKDIGFYVFQLPFLRFIVDWLFAGLVIVLLVTAVAHYLNGGIRFQSPFQRVTPQVKAHLSVILAVMALVKTAQYYFDRFELDFSQRGAVNGASYTDVKAQLPALNLLIFISIVAAGLFIWNIWRRGWVLPIIAVGLWGFVSLVIGTIYPAGVQQFRVEPNEFQKERHVHRAQHRGDTGARSGSRRSTTEPFDYQQNLDARRRQSTTQTTIDNARLWDPTSSEATYQSAPGPPDLLQVRRRRHRPLHDRRPDPPGRALAREINRGELPSQSWVNQHLVYTHGYGVDRVADERRRPGRRTPTSSSATSRSPRTRRSRSTSPRSYFGESQAGLRRSSDAKQRGVQLLDARARRRDHALQGQGRRQARQLAPPGRVRVAVRRHQPADLGSGPAGTRRSCYVRDIQDRVEKLAPFLEFDADPYPVVIDGRVMWVLDAYTTTSRYPYSQMTSAAERHRPEPRFNYVRNSVKATVDAYDGTVKFYVIDPKDPMIQVVPAGVPGPVHRLRRDAERPEGRTCATRRTCSGCRPTCTARTT